jgi:hypothetical protein
MNRSLLHRLETGYRLSKAALVVEISRSQSCFVVESGSATTQLQTAIKLKASRLKSGFGIAMDVGAVIEAGTEGNENLKPFSIEGVLAAFGTSIFRVNLNSDEFVVAVNGF